uniref:XRN 5'-3' exonuclease n=1 Tax=Pithovirus LCPAC403 TaxID=2506596 RepID=A0A481ZBV2_9VIRU|nr:MAG: XRN 5'-3' exonuclease [Pithovirus LCPAC403]
MNYYVSKLSRSSTAKRPHTLSIDVDSIIRESHGIERLITNTIVNIFEQVQPYDLLVLSISGVVPAAEIKYLKEERYLSSSPSSGKPFLSTPSKTLSIPLVDSRSLSELTAGTDIMISIEEAIIKWIDIANLPPKVYLMGQFVPGNSIQKIVKLMKRHTRIPLFKDNNIHIIYTQNTEIFLMMDNRPNIYIYRPSTTIKIFNIGDYLSVDDFNDVIYDIMGNKPTTIRDFTFLNLFTGVKYIPTYPIAEDVSTFMKAATKAYRTLGYPLTGSNGQIKWQNVLAFLEVFEEPKDRIIFPSMMKKEKTISEASSSLSSRILSKSQLPSEPRSLPKSKRSSVDDDFRNRWYKHALGLKGPIPVYETRFGDCELNFTITENMIIKMSIEYIYGLEWSYRYINEGDSNISIGWSYPYNYTPLLSDVKSVLSTLIKNNSLPSVEATQSPHTYHNVIHQLVAVTPRASRSVLPNEVDILLKETSPILKTFYNNVLIDTLGLQKRAILPKLDFPFIVRVVNEVTSFSMERAMIFREQKTQTFLEREGEMPYMPVTYKIQNKYITLNETNVLKNVLNTAFKIVDEGIVLSVIGLSPTSMIDISVFWEDNRINKLNIYTDEEKTVRKYIETLSHQDKSLNVGSYVDKFQDVVYINKFNYLNVTDLIKNKTDLFVIRIGKKLRFYSDKYPQYYVFTVTNFDDSPNGYNYIFISRRSPNIGSMKDIKVKEPKGVHLEERRDKKAWKAINKRPSVKESIPSTSGILFASAKEFVPEESLSDGGVPPVIELPPSIPSISIPPVIKVPPTSEIIQAIDHAANLLIMMSSNGSKDMSKITLILQIYNDDYIQSLLDDDRIVHIRTYHPTGVINTSKKMSVFSLFDPNEIMKSSSTANIVMLDREEKEKINIEDVVCQILNDTDLVIVKADKSFTFNLDRFENINEIETKNYRFIFISQHLLMNVPYLSAPSDVRLSDETYFHGEHLPDFMIKAIENLPIDNRFSLTYEHNIRSIDSYIYPEDHRMALKLKDRSMFLSIIYFISKYGAQEIDLLLVIDDVLKEKDLINLLELFDEIVSIYVYADINTTNDKIIVHNYDFDEDIKKWSDREDTFLFVANEGNQWYEIMKDNVNMISTMIDFGTKEESEVIKWYAGEEIFYVPWDSGTRIILKSTPKSLRQKDHLHYKESLNYVNNVVREWQWIDNDIDEVDNCFDSAVEIAFWIEYLMSRGENISKVESIIPEGLDCPPYGLYRDEKMTEGRREKLIKYVTERREKKKKELYSSF